MNELSVTLILSHLWRPHVTGIKLDTDTLLQQIAESYFRAQ